MIRHIPLEAIDIPAARELLKWQHRDDYIPFDQRDKRKFARRFEPAPVDRIILKEWELSALDVSIFQPLKIVGCSVWEETEEEYSVLDSKTKKLKGIPGRTFICVGPGKDTYIFDLAKLDDTRGNNLYQVVATKQ